MRNRLRAASALLVGICGCASAPVNDTAAELTSRLDALQARVDQLEKRSEREDRIRESETAAYLTPGNPGYSVLKTESGALTVNLESIQPADVGTRVILRFGNTANATLDRVRATVEWGKSDNGFRSEAAGSKTVAFSQAFPRGQWINVDVVLEGVLPGEIAFIRVKDLEHAGISLLGLPSPASRAQD
jgi:hypothetical protein